MYLLKIWIVYLDEIIAVEICKNFNLLSNIHLLVRPWKQVTTNAIINYSRKERFSIQNLFVLDSFINDTACDLIPNDKTASAFHV